MGLKDKVELSIKEAMKAKQTAVLRGLREIKAQLLLAETSGQGEVTEEKEISVLQKMAKQRQDSIAIYEEQDRTDLAQKEKEELEVIMQFLPEPLSTEELTAMVQNIITKLGASGMKDMGRVMPAAKEAASGRADGRTLSEIIRKLLV